MLDRSSAPKAYALDDISFKHPEKTKINNIDGFIIRASSHPVIILEILFKSGKAYESYPGVAFFTSKMLSEGTTERKSEDISLAFEETGSYFDIQPGIDHISIKLYSLKKHFNANLQILKELLVHSTFPTGELEQLKQIRIAQIESQLARNSQFATLKFNEHIFGHEHPAGRILEPDEIRKLHRDEVIGYYQNGLFVDPMFMIAGDIDADNLLCIEQLFEEIPLAQSNKGLPTGHLIDRKLEISRGSEQASIRIGTFAPHANHQDVHYLNIANTLLGGFFGSRLMKNIREEKGLTYGIYSTLINRLEASYWLIGSEVNMDKKEEALKAIYHELEVLATDFPADDEIEILKNYLRGKLLTNMDSIYNQMNSYRSILVYERDVSFIDDFIKAVNEVTASDITQIIDQYYFKPEKLELTVC
jgi:predicted Zn-dependent peptidase